METEIETLDMRDEINRLEEEIAQTKQEAAETDPESEEGKALEKEFKSLKKRLNAFKSYLNRWGQGEFVVKELTFGQTMTIKDKVQRASFEADVKTGEFEGVPRDGYYRVETLRQAVVDAPDQAPPDVGNYPYHIGEWLYQKIDEMNSAKGIDTEDLWQGATESE